MKYTVYKITNTINGKFYVGVHKTKDLTDDYYGSGSAIKAAIKKYGIENFKKEITHLCESSEEMFRIESKIVDADFVASKNTYNIKVGGFGGWDYINAKGGQGERLNKNLSHEKRSKGGKNSGIGELNRKRMQGDPATVAAFRKQCADAFRGKRHTEEAKRKISEASSKRESGKGNSQYGTCWIFSPIEKKAKKIKLEHLNEYVNIGWYRGRKMKTEERIGEQKHEKSVY